MLVLVTSDFHGYEKAFKATAEIAEEEKSDLLIICGDITNFGTIKQAEKYLSQLVALKKPVLFVPGNCDLPSLLTGEINGAVNLHQKCVLMNDYSFIGIGGAPISPLNTPLEFPEEQMMKWLEMTAEKCSSNKLILVSHSPPYDTKLDLAFIGEHVGSYSVRRFIEERKPIAVFCGHVHEARGIDKIGSSILVNPGPARHGFYAIVNLDEDVKVVLKNFKGKG